MSKFITLAYEDSGEFVNINIDHIVKIDVHVKHLGENKFEESSKIYLTTREVIHVAEAPDTIENEYPYLFNQPL
jgi:hypothetical protein